MKKTSVSSSTAKESSRAGGLGQKACNAIDLLTKSVTKKIVSLKREENPEAVPDVQKPFHGSIRIEIPDFVQSDEVLKEEVNEEWLETLRNALCFNIPVRI